MPADLGRNGRGHGRGGGRAGRDSARWRREKRRSGVRASARSAGPPRKPISTSGSTSTGAARPRCAPGIGFFDHMLEALARHALLDLTVEAQGDLHVDGHHTVEDTGIALGLAHRAGAGRPGRHPPLRRRAGAARRGAGARGGGRLRAALSVVRHRDPQVADAGRLRRVPDARSSSARSCSTPGSRSTWT